MPFIIGYNKVIKHSSYINVMENHNFDERMKKIKEEESRKREEKCPDCGHERKYHMNLVGCCYPIEKSPSSKKFEGGIEYCYCQRLEGFVKIHLERRNEF